MPTAMDIRIIWPANLVIDVNLLSIILATATSIVTAPNMPAPPLANSSQLIDANILATKANTPTATDIRIICPANLVISELPLFMILAALTRITVAPNMPAPPLANSSQLIDANNLATKDIAPTAAAIRIIWPANLVILDDSLSIALAARTSMATVPNMPAPPLANSSQLIDANNLATKANAPTAMDIRIICPANLVILDDSLSIALVA